MYFTVFREAKGKDDRKVNFYIKLNFELNFNLQL